VLPLVPFAGIVASGVPWPAVAGSGPSAVITQSPNDDRAYRHIELPNGLRVILVSDPATDRAAAALDVSIGSRHDPPEYRGLAHFLEHMLFLGTRKYPEAGAYQRYIQQHGGSNNASTGYEHTNFFFEIDRGHLEGALDRFAQFFVAPLFNETRVDRERHAVDSEYRTRLRSDGSRSWDAIKQAFNPRHPLSRFSIGSLQTLRNRPPGALRAALIRFWKAHYSADRMTLVVYGAEALDTLEGWVAARFRAVPRGAGGEGDDRVAEPLFRPGSLPARVEITPLRDLRSLTLYFPMPPVLELYRVKPTLYLSNILGHEGKGSLLSALKAKGWADGVSAGLGFSARDASLYRIRIRLTAAGLEHLPEITGRVFELVAKIRTGGLERWRFLEQSKLLDLGFRFQERVSPVGYAVEVARNLHLYPPADVLVGPYRLDDPDAAVVERFVGYLKPENLLAVVVAPGLETDRRSPSFSTPFHLGPLPSAWAGGEGGRPASSPALELPASNSFIPRDLSLVRTAPRPALPVVDDETSGLLLVKAPDASFGIPKANVFLSVRSPRAQDSALHSVLTSLYTRIVKDQLQEETYPASLAGLDYELYPHLRGFTLRVSGYSDRLGRLLETVARRLSHPRIDGERLGIVADDLRRTLENRKKAGSARIAMRELRRSLITPSWSDGQKLEALPRATPERLARFVPELLGSLDAVLMAHGNIDADRVERYRRIVRETLLERTPAVRIVAVPRAAVVELETGERARRVRDVEHADSALVVYRQGRSRDMAERARFALLAQVLSAPFYLELRTHQQLGYVVYATRATYFEVPGLAFVIQSPRVAPAELEWRVETFLSGFEARLGGMSETEFAAHKAGLLARIRKKATSLGERSERYWTEIDRRRWSFDSRKRLAEAVEAVGLDGLRAAYRQALLAPRARGITVWTRGERVREASGGKGPPARSVEGYRPILDVRAFRAAHRQYRSP